MGWINPSPALRLLYARGRMYEDGNASILQLNYFIMNLW